MPNISCEQEILHYILHHEPGTVFAIADFSRFGTYDAIRQALSRLTQRKVLTRITSGIYCLASSSDDPDYEPLASDVASALARNNNWTVLPGTELARFYFKLSETKPTSDIYLSTGPTMTYNYGKNKKLKMVSTKGKFMVSMSSDAALVVSALMNLNAHKIKASEVYQLSIILSLETKENLLNNLRSIPARLRPVIEIICDQFGKTSR